MKHVELVLVAVGLEDLHARHAEFSKNQAIEIARHRASQIGNLAIAAYVHLAQFDGVDVELRRLEESYQHLSRKILRPAQRTLRAREHLDHVRKECPVERAADGGELLYVVLDESRITIGRMRLPSRRQQGVGEIDACISAGISGRPQRLEQLAI